MAGYFSNHSQFQTRLQMQHLTPTLQQLLPRPPPQQRLDLESPQAGTSPLPLRTHHTKTATEVPMFQCLHPFTLSGIRMFVASSSFSSVTNACSADADGSSGSDSSVLREIKSLITKKALKRLPHSQALNLFGHSKLTSHHPLHFVPTTDYLLFHAGVRRPVWEDP